MISEQVDQARCNIMKQDLNPIQHFKLEFNLPCQVSFGLELSYKLSLSDLCMHICTHIHIHTSGCVESSTLTLLEGQMYTYRRILTKVYKQEFLPASVLK